MTDSRLCTCVSGGGGSGGGGGAGERESGEGGMEGGEGTELKMQSEILQQTNAALFDDRYAGLYN